jgi:hypothetical protein
VIAAGELISEKYRVMQRILHGQARPYGDRGDKWAEVVITLMHMYQAWSVLDYGCGQGSLKRAVLEMPKRSGVRVDEYDPAIPGKDALPSFADLVVATDMLEHVEPDRLEAVLGHLKALARKAVFVVVAIQPDSSRVLADGRNAHLIVRPANWWKKHCEAAGFTVKRAPACARKKKSHEWTAVLEPC